MKTVSILVVLLILTYYPLFGADARSLKGGVSQEELHYKLDLKKQSAKTHEEASGDGLTKEGGVVKQPAWIEGNVFTNDDMFMYSYWDIPPFKKKFVWKVPTHKRSKMTFSDKIIKHWKGFKPRKPGKMICEPIDKSGRFRFHHKNPKGPSGYFELVGKSKKGFYRYRIWFNES